MVKNSQPTVPSFRSSPEGEAFLSKRRQQRRRGAPSVQVTDPEVLRSRVLRAADWVNNQGTPGDTWSQNFVDAERIIRQDALDLGGDFQEAEEWGWALEWAILWTPRWDGPVGPDGRYDQGPRLLK